MAAPTLPGRPGYIVAVEGPEELVSTQLHLLPASPQIAILPSLQEYLDDTDPPASLGEGELISQYHAAAQARHAEALEFLDQSTSSEDRRLVFMHGGTLSAHAACLSAIMEHAEDCDVDQAHAIFSRLTSSGAAALLLARTGWRQADALSSMDAEVGEGLGPGRCGGYVDSGGDTFEDRIIRAMRAADALDRETEFLQPPTPDVDLTVELVSIPSRPRRTLSSTATEGPETPRDPRSPSPSGNQSRGPAEPAFRLPHASSTEGTPSTAIRKPPLRIRIPPALGADVAANESPQPQHDHTRPASDHTRLSSDPSPRQTVSGDGDSQGGAGSGRSRSLPRGDPRELENARSEVDEHLVEPVLPLLEDLVVYLTPQSPNELHDFVFRRLSEGCKTPRPSIPGFEVPQDDSQDEGHPAMETGLGCDPQSDDDPVHGSAVWIRGDLVHGLPTPNHSPSPSGAAALAVSPLKTKLCSISTGQETAASVQNLLRSLLASHFPAHEHHLWPTDGTETPTEPDLWETLKRDGLFAGPDGESRLDLLLAVGAESGVNKSRLSEVVAQLEQLGNGSSGLSRSGRVDIRYLIANAMQAFTAQPLTKQTQSNPFADRALLAALIIPHIETYLATHPDVRLLLIEYPSEHLPTVLALQTVIGTDLVKVVGIVNSNDSHPLRPGAGAHHRHSQCFRSSTRGSRGSAFAGPCFLSKGNFLLSSSATGSETAAFVAAIRESLISVSDDYMSERPLYKHAPQTPSKKGHSNTSIDTQPAGSVSVHRQSEPSRVSVSTFIITPPSSPAESPAAQPHQLLPHHVNLRSVPPRSSSSASPSSRGALYNDTPSLGQTATSFPGRHTHWDEVHYASSPAPFTTAATGTSNRSHHKKTNHRPHHRKTSDPLASVSDGGVVFPFPPLSSPTSTATTILTTRPTTATGRIRHGTPSPSSSRYADTGAALASSINNLNNRRNNHNNHCNSNHPNDSDQDDSDQDDSDQQDAEEMRLMPLYLRRRRRRRTAAGDEGQSTKALRWLGLV